jgi:hypothetical protein
MAQTLTVISHIRNEEALLVLWLRHHRTIFDHGIIIDYKSNDRSLAIVRELCPSWDIITTRNLWPDGRVRYNADLVDAEVKAIECTLDGFKMALNTTEFLVVTTDNFAASLVSGTVYRSVGHYLYGRAPSNPTTLLELLDVVSCAVRVPITDAGRDRAIHDLKPAPYNRGRHSLRCTTEHHPQAYLFYLRPPFPYSDPFYRRALQIKETHDGPGQYHMRRTRQSLGQEAQQQMRFARDHPCVWDGVAEAGTVEHALQHWRSCVVATDTAT